MKVRIIQRATKEWESPKLEALISSVTFATTRTRKHAHEYPTGAERVSKRDLPRLVRDTLNERGDGGNDRSEAVNAIVKDCLRAGLTPNQTAGVLTGTRAAERFEAEGRLFDQIGTVRCKNLDLKKADRIKKKPTPAKFKNDDPAMQQTRRTSWTLDELMDTDFPELKWLLPGIVPEGLTLIVSAPKIGKSYLVMNLALAVIQGVDALGSLKIDAGEVLIIPLDDPSPRRMKDRAKEITGAMGQYDPEFKLHLELDWPSLADGGDEQLDKWLTKHSNCRLVIIDTLSRLRDEEARSTTSEAGKPDERAMATLKAIADKHRTAILCTHHDRKMGADDFLDMVAGNKKLTGGADTIIYISRKRLQPHATVRITGRDVEEQELVFLFDFPVWRVTDEKPVEVNMSDTRREIVAYLREHDEGTAGSIADATGHKTDTINQRLYQMKQAGEVWQPRGPRTPYALAPELVREPDHAEPGSRGRAGMRQERRNNRNCNDDGDAPTLRHYDYDGDLREDARARESGENNSGSRAGTTRKRVKRRRKSEWRYPSCGGLIEFKLTQGEVWMIPHHRDDCPIKMGKDDRLAESLERGDELYSDVTAANEGATR